jgi:formylglycine-generating enzyme required for sulfatase activity
MMLKPGNYKIEVSKPGFQTQIKWLAIGKEDQLRETIKLVSNRSYSQLYVNPKPSDAKIRILNIVPKYTPGIALQAGKYLIEISKSGYRTYKEWVKISQYEDLTIEPVLELIQPNVKTFAQLKPVKKESSVEAVKKEISVEDIRNEVVESPKTTPETVQKKEISLSKKAPEQYVYQPKKEDSNLKKLPETNDQQVPEKETFDQKKVESDKKTTETVSQEEQQQPALKTESFEKDQWVESITGMKFAWIKGGCYDMGCGSWTAQCDTDETPVHKVCVKGFWMGQYEVTQMEWQTIMENNPSLSAYGNYYPVEKVSWNDVQTYIQKLEKKSGHQFRLPTEAEWEYACRSCGKPQKYSGKGLDLNHIGWFAENSQLITHSVGYKAPNDFDLYDMSGNVAEWCLDSYQDGAYKNHSKNSPVNKNGDEKVVRGGDWSDEYQRLRCSDRRGFHKDMKSSDLGFRLIRIKN